MGKGLVSMACGSERKEGKEGIMWLANNGRTGGEGAVQEEHSQHLWEGARRKKWALAGGGGGSEITARLSAPTTEKSIPFVTFVGRALVRIVSCQPLKIKEIKK
jgi:hypothetical protein